MINLRQCFMLSAIFRERLLLQVYVCYCIYFWFYFTLYTLKGKRGPLDTGGHGWRPLVDRAAAAGGQRMFQKVLDRKTWCQKEGILFKKLLLGAIIRERLLLCIIMYVCSSKSAVYYVSAVAGISTVSGVLTY